MRRSAVHLRLVLGLLAWFAQLCVPVVHASLMAAPQGGMPGWCGDPARALAVAAQLPPEIRDALGLGAGGAEHLANCAELCAMGAAPTIPVVASTPVLRAAGIEPPHTIAAVPRTRNQSRTPPSQGPPAVS